MARLKQQGVSFQFLYEYEGMLAEIIADLGLEPLNEVAEKRFREHLGFAMGKWREPNTGVDTKELGSSLKQLANQLEAMDPLFAALEMGRHREPDFEAATRLSSALSEVPTIGSVDAARTVIGEFRRNAGIIATAARDAALELQSIKGKGGHPGNAWYDDFVVVVSEVCAANGIAVKSVSSRKMDEPSGRFFEVAQGLERVLLPKMRSPSPHALAKRINKSLKRISVE